MERYLRVNLLGPGPRLIKKNLPGRGLTKVEKHCLTALATVFLHCLRNKHVSYDKYVLHALQNTSESGTFRKKTHRNQRQIQEIITLARKI